MFNYLLKNLKQKIKKHRMKILCWFYLFNINKNKINKKGIN